MIFKIENINKQFSEKFVLKNFSLDVFEGDKINISGPSALEKLHFSDFYWVSIVPMKVKFTFTKTV